MFNGISGLVDFNAPDKYKIAIVGEQKTGKSWFALTMPGSIFVADFDDRSSSAKEYVRMTKREDIVVKTYKDKNQQYPNAVLEFEADISALEYAKQQGEEIPQTFVIDSITFLRACVERELMRQHSNLSRTVRLGSTSIRIPQGWDIVNGNRAYIEYLVNRLSELGNIICIFHEMDEKDVQLSTKEEKKYTGRKTIQPQYLSTLLSTFNDVFRISLDYANNRLVTVKPSADFLASTTMTKLGEVEKPDLNAMIAKQRE